MKQIRQNRPSFSGDSWEQTPLDCELEPLVEFEETAEHFPQSNNTIRAKRAIVWTEENFEYPCDEPPELFPQMEHASKDLATDVEKLSSDQDAQEKESNSNKLPKVYKCPGCQTQFSRHMTAVNHCVKKQAWKCEKCGEAIKQKNNIARHKARCLNRVQKPMNPKEPVDNITGDKKHLCNLCGKEFKNCASLKTHRSIQHKGEKEGILSCDLCDFRTETEQHLKKHITLKHGVRVEFRCKECDYTCFSKSGLKKHRLYVHKKQADQAKEIDKLEKATRVIGEPNAADLVDILPDSEINPELDSSIVVINLDEIEVFAVNDQTVDPVEKTLKFSEL